MLKVHSEEKDLVPLYWADPMNPANNKSVLVNLALVVI
jgi:hypothetical protein